MATTRRPSRANASPKAAPPREAVDAVEVDSLAIDSVLEDWSQNTAKQQISWEISAANAMLRSAQSFREAQVEMGQRAQRAYDDAADQLRKARGLSDLAAVQMALAKADAESVMEFWAKLGESSSRGVMDLWNESVNGMARMNESALSAWTQWTRLQAALPTSPETIEAEVEHVTNPLNASPMMWPAQEATRQAMTMAASTWNEWLSLSGRLMGDEATRAER